MTYRDNEFVYIERPFHRLKDMTIVAVTKAPDYIIITAGIGYPNEYETYPVHSFMLGVLKAEYEACYIEVGGVNENDITAFISVAGSPIIDASEEVINGQQVFTIATAEHCITLSYLLTETHQPFNKAKFLEVEKFDPAKN